MRPLVTAVVTALIAGTLLTGTAEAATAGAAPERRTGPVRLSSASVSEDAPAGRVVGWLSARDQVRYAALRYRLVAGPGSRDNASFTIDERRLTVAGALDFETAPTLLVRVRVSDGRGWHRTGPLRVAVRDVADQPPADLLLSPAEVAENEPAGSLVGTLSTQDAETYTYTLLPGADGDLFEVVGDQLRTAAPLDHEQQPRRSVVVQARSGSGDSFQRQLTVAVTDANDVPTGVLLTPSAVAEGTGPGLVGTLAAVDEDAADTFTYALVSGAGDADNGSFSVAGAELSTSAYLDFESRDSYSVRVRVTDAGGATYERALTVTVSDVSEAPGALSLSNDTVPENAAVGTLVGRVTASDPDGDAITYQLVTRSCRPGTALRACRVPRTPFEITPDGVLTTGRSFDHETTPTQVVRVRATDTEGASREADLTVRISDVNDAPSGMTLVGDTVEENAPAGTVVGQVTGIDQDDDTLTYELVTPPPPCRGVDGRHARGCRRAGGPFELSAAGELTTGATFDHESTPTQTVRVRATDPDGEWVESDLTVTVTDVNEDPTDFAFTYRTVNRGWVFTDEAPGAVVGQLSAADPDSGDVLTYSLDAPSTSFAVAADGNVSVAGALVGGTQPTIQVRVTDAGGLSATTSVRLQIHFPCERGGRPVPSRGGAVLRC